MSDFRVSLERTCAGVHGFCNPAGVEVPVDVIWGSSVKSGLSRLVLVSLVAATTLVGFGGAAATAQTRTVSDKSKDVTRFGGASHGVADIKKVRITHSKSALSVVVKFKNLTTTNWTSVYVGSQSNKKASDGETAMSVFRNGGEYSEKVYLAGDAGAAPHCVAQTDVQNGKGGWVRLSAPRHCFLDQVGNMPTRIRSYAAVYNASSQQAGAYDFSPLGFGPWVKRG
jgi:hypothetical protein